MKLFNFQAFVVPLIVATVSFAACNGEEEPADVSPIPVVVDTPEVIPLGNQPGPDVGSAPTTNQTPLLPDELEFPYEPPPSLTNRFESNVLELDHLLTAGEVRQFARWTGQRLEEGAVEGQAPSETYNSVRFHPEGLYGLAIQVWELEDPNEAREFFNRLFATYPTSEEADGVGDTAFRSDFGGIQQLVFYVRRADTVIAVSCDDEFCADPEAITRIGTTLQDRF